jgi:periplasmic protein TonB
MNRRLFEDLIESAPATRNRRRAAVLPLSLTAHAAVVGLVLFLQAVGPADGPAVAEAAPRIGWIPPSPPPSNPQPTPAPVRMDRRPPGHSSALEPAPVAIPRPGPPAPVTETSEVPFNVDAPPPCFSDCDGPPGPPAGDGREGRGGDGEGGGGGPIRVVSSGIREPRRLVYVAPVYPDIARRAHVEGFVIVDCTIDAQGRVIDARVLKGHPLLDEAAVSAVRQWRYSPTLLSGVPVPVLMTVTVHFVLQR